ncbi:MAG: hypothetical protein ACOYM0_15985, partial [Bacteroidales bacterium]
GDLDFQAVNTERFYYEFVLAVNHPAQVVNRSLGGVFQWKLNAKLICDFLDLSFKAHFTKVLDKLLSLTIVGVVIEGKNAILADGEVVHLVSTGWNAEILGVAFENFRNELYQSLAIGSGYVVVNFHFQNLLSFLYVHISL